MGYLLLSSSEKKNANPIINIRNTEQEDFKKLIY